MADASKEVWDSDSEEGDMWWGSDSDSDGDDGKGCSKAFATEQLANLLCDLFVSGKMSARLVCTICWWCSLAGMGGAIEELKLSPLSLSHRFSRKLKTFLGIKRRPGRQVRVRCPCYSSAGACRVEAEIPCVPIYEALDDEAMKDPHLALKLNLQIERNEVPPSYASHPVVVAAGLVGIVAHAVVVYLDGVPTIRRDGVLGIFAYFWITGKRHLITIIRKSRLCRCGCRGWCTLFPVFLFINHSLIALADGHHPKLAWDGTPFTEGLRLELVGVQLLIVGAVVAVKGDWAEFCHTLGFLTWKSPKSPCLFCLCSKEDWEDDADLSVGDFPFTLVTHFMYLAYCSANEVKRTLSLEDRIRISRSLIYDKRSSGFRGRALIRDLPEFRLLIGDRVEPSESLIDVGKFEEVPSIIEVTFWRVVNNRVRHRNPLFNSITGVTLLSLLVDALHAYVLGVLKEFTMHVLWEMIICNFWAIHVPHATEDVMLDLGCSAMFRAYEKFVDRNADDISTRIEKFPPTMMGKKNERCLNVKGGETVGLFLFVSHELETHGQKLPNGEFWTAAAVSLRSIHRLSKAAPLHIATYLRKECGQYEVLER